MTRRCLRDDEYASLEIASECEKAIKQKIEELSKGKLTLKAVGFGTGLKDKIAGTLEEKIKHLDYDAIIGEKVVAIIEISCTNYTFERSKFFPINAYKWRTEELPIYYVYSLEKEPCDLLERCWWITQDKATNNLLQPNPVWLETERPEGIKLQRNYIVNKNAWIRGLQSLVASLVLRLGDR